MCTFLNNDMTNSKLQVPFQVGKTICQLVSAAQLTLRLPTAFRTWLKDFLTFSAFDATCTYSKVPYIQSPSSGSTKQTTYSILVLKALFLTGYLDDRWKFIRLFTF